MKRFITLMAAFCGLSSFVASPAFAADVSSAAELKAAIEAGGEITLTADIELAEMLTVSSSTTVTLDLNGKAITVGYQKDSTDRHLYPFDVYGTMTIKDSAGNGSITGRGIYVQDGSKVTLESGAIYGIDSNGGSAFFQYGGDIVINGGRVEQKAEGTYNFAINAAAGTVTVNGGWVGGNHGAIAAVGAKVVIEDGEFVCTGTAKMTDNVLYSYDTGTLTINGGTFTADSDGYSGGSCVYDANGKTVINGGTFGNSSGGDVLGTTGTVINGGIFENLIETKHVTVGSTIINGGKTYTKTESGLVEVSYVAKIGDAEYTTLQAAIDAAQAGQTIILVNAVPVTENVTIATGKDIVLDLNGKTITPANDLVNLLINGKLTINDTVGTGVSTFRNHWVKTGGELVLNGGTVQNIATASGGYPVNLESGATATINGGTVQAVFDDNYTVSVKAGAELTIKGGTLQGPWGVVSTAGTVVIDNGIFNVTKDIGGHCVYASAGTVTINDGDFNPYNKDGSATSYSVYVNGADVTINGGDFDKELYGRALGKGDNGTLTVKGGTFTSNKSYLDSHLKAFVVDGYMVVDNGGDSYTVVEAVAKVGDTFYATFAEALTAASAMTGNVTVELFQKVTMTSGLSGSYDSITFVGKTDSAEIYLEVQGYVTAPGKKVAFTGLKLSKSSGGFIANAGFMNVAFGIYNVSEVAYTNCYFVNGAYASSGTVTFTGCTFKRSYDKYGLWAYGDVNCIVDNCVFDDYRGIKMYAEGAKKTVALKVTNTDFSALTDKPAIVLTYGESVELDGNTYSDTGTFELDLGGSPNGTPVTVDADEPLVCVNDNGSCGVLVGDKIYMTVTAAAAAATAGDTVKLLHNSNETVELPAGVTLDKNGYTAAGVTVAPVAQVGETKYATLTEAIAAAQADETIIILADLTLAEAVALPADITLDLDGKSINGTISALGNITILGGGYIKTLSSTSGGTITVEDNTTLALNNFSFGKKENNTAEYTITGGTITANYGFFQHGIYKLYSDFETGYMYYSYGSDITVYGTFHSQGKGDGLDYVRGKLTIAAGGKSIHDKALWVGQPASWGAMESALIVEEGGSLTIGNMPVYNGSSLESAGNITGTITKEADATIAISGGTYTQEIPQEWCAAGYVPVNRGEGKYGVAVEEGKVAVVGKTTYTTLEDAIAAAKQSSDTVTLLTDITLDKNIESSVIIVIDKAITLDGNGFTLTSTAGRAINVSGANGVTIKNLTIKASGERAINIIQGATNVTIDNVTATAANYTVNVATSAGAAKVAITNSTLTGACTVNVSAAGADVTIDNSTVNCVDNNTTTGESYAALSLNAEATDGSIIATNTTVNVTEGSDSVKGRNSAEGGTVTINGSTDVTTIVAVITYEGSDYYHGFTSLAEAIEFASEGDTITLIRDITEKEIVVLDKAITLDGNGKTLTSTAGRAINVSGANGVTIKNLEISCTGERGINIIQGATNVTIDNVTATADNYAVNVAGSAKDAQVTITNSNLTGLNVVNVGAVGANVTVTDTKITCNDQNEDEVYAALCLNMDAVGAKITANGCTFDMKGDSQKARNSAENGTITIGGSTDGVVTMVAAIKYGNYHASFATLADAIEAAEAGQTITLIRDITEDEIVTINKAITLDGNGKTLTSTATRAINVSGANGVTIKDLIINCTGERGINVIQGATNVTIDGCTIDANNYAVNVAGSAAKAVVTVKNSDLTGLNVVNVGAVDAEVTVTDTTLTNDNTDENQAFAVLSLNKDATGGKITANGCSFTLGVNTDKALNSAENGTIVIDGSSDGIDESVAYVDYGDYFSPYPTLAQAIAQAKDGDKVVLIRDITEDEIVTINKAITLDGNGKTLTSTAARAINVDCNGDVAIKNLTINASGERAINVIYKPANLTIDNVTATAANYTVNVAAGAKAVVTITNSDLTGLNVVNVAVEDAVVTITDTKLTCNDQSELENYAALCLHKIAVGATITATDCTFDVKDDSFKAKNDAEDGVITIDGSTDGVVTMVAAITYGDSYYTFTSLADAIEFASEDDTITLLRDIKSSEIITIDKAITLDGNDKTLTSTAGRAINVATEGNVTIKNLTINCSGERGINVITEPANLKIENCNITANNYAVNVASSAGAAQVSITGGTLTGLNVVNVAGADADVTIATSTINCALNTTAEKYAALCLNKDATGATITVDGDTTINVGSTSEVARNGATNGSIKINGVESGSAVVAVIEYGNYYASFTTLAEAIDAAKDGQTVKLLKDVESSEIITINKAITLDGNGKTLTYTGTNRAIEMANNAELELNVTIANLKVVAANAERGINYNDNSTLTLNNVVVEGAPVYALNLPGMSDGAKVVLNDCSLTGNIALNLWGENIKVTATDTAFISVDNSADEDYAAIKLNNDGTTAATGTEVNVSGGSVIAYKEDGTTPSVAVEDAVAGTVTIENTTDDTQENYTEVVGEIQSPVAVVIYDGADQFYTCMTLQDAVTTATGNANATVKLVLDSAESVAVNGAVVFNVNGKSYTGTVTLTDTAASLTAADGLTVASSVEGYEVAYENGAYTLVEIANVAKIGDVEYKTLQEAIDAATAGQTVQLIADVALTETVTVAADDNIILELNGKTVSMVYAEDATANHEMILNSGNLTIQDSVGGGKLSYTYTGASLGTTYAANTITSNPGSVLTVKSGTIENLTYDSAIIAYAIDGRTNGGAGDVTVNIEGGTITSKRQSIRIFANSTTNTGTLNIKGGEMTGRVIVQSSNTSANMAALNITGGTFNANDYKTDVLYVGGNNSSTIDIDASVTGGTFNGLITDTEVKGFISGGTFKYSVNEGYCAGGFTPVKNESGSYGVGVLPDAEVSNLGAITVGEGDYDVDSYYIYDLVGQGGLTTGIEPFDLSLAMNFTAKDTEEQAKANAFGHYTTDFFLTLTGIDGDSFEANGCYLAGYYPSYGAWVKIPLDGFTVEDGVTYPVISSAGFDFKYKDICASVQQFICGIYLTPEVLKANPDLEVELTLGLAENVEAAEDAKFIEVDGYTYDVEDLMPIPELPTATVTQINAPDGTPLTFALNFKADTATDEQLEYYGDWYADFVLTITGLPEDGVTFNADETADGYLAGQYDEWSENWVVVPPSDVTLKNGESIKIMEYAATLLGQSGLKLTYNDVYSFVKDFDCGVYFTPEFLAANPNMKVSLTLRMYETGDASDEGVVIGEMEEFTAPVVVAKIGDIAYSTLQAAIDAAESGDTITVLKDIALTEIVTVAADDEITLDLNGKKINAAFNGESTTNHIYAFTNNGTLTITDTSADKNGAINSRGNYNYGTLILEAGTINAIDGNGGYAVWNKAGSTFTMDGGTVAATYEDDNKVDEGGYDATTVRVEADATFTMNGGVINNVSDFTFAIDNSGTTTVKGGTITSVHTTVRNNGTMTIDGGSFTCNGVDGKTQHVVWAEKSTITINGGTFNGKDTYNGFNVTASAGAIVDIKGGNFLSVHSGSLHGEGTIAVSGGTFFDAVSENRCAEGYIPVDNADGTYGVKKGTYVAQVGDVKYTSLQVAIDAAEVGTTVTILNPEAISDPLYVKTKGEITEATATKAMTIATLLGGSFKVTKDTANNKILVYAYELGITDIDYYAADKITLTISLMEENAEGTDVAVGRDYTNRWIVVTGTSTDGKTTTEATALSAFVGGKATATLPTPKYGEFVGGARALNLTFTITDEAPATP